MQPSEKYNYQYGSTARKLEYDVYEENAFLRNKRKKFKYTQIKTKMFLISLLLFACGMIVMYRYAIITELNYDIQDARVMYDRIQNDNLVTRMSIQSSLDLANVRDIAENDLRMHEPRREQIVMVNVPRDDFIQGNVNLAKDSDDRMFSIINRLN